MNVVLIHGRGQAGKDPDALQEEWMAGMRKGFAAAGKQPSAMGEVSYPFYGDLLKRLVDSLPGKTRTLSRGEASEDAADAFERQFVARLAERAGVDPAEATADLPVREKGLDRWGVVHRLVRAVERKLPWTVDVVIGEQLEDVKAYASNAFIQQKVNDVILPNLQKGPAVVVSHSLGTVVAYIVLASHPELNVPLFITAGSPLGLGTIKEKLPIPLAVQGGHWLNISDPEDIVALYPSLDAGTFIAGIENITDIENGDKPHSIAGYLSDARVGGILAEALS